MSLTKFIRDVQKIHEAIPTPGAIFYNATAAKILRKPERKRSFISYFIYIIQLTICVNVYIISACSSIWIVLH
ncbi:MAG: hypothetical protein KJ821_06210, partial [Actinobacteria bacterium]|nr:hypothetical protein [Actinomycetota bacterium]